MGSCPSEAEVSAFVDGRVGPAARERLVAHLDACSACREVVAALARDAPRAASAEHPDAASRPTRHSIAIGDRVGRYVVVDTLGRGGMGVVFAARDEALDRRVALKVVRASAGGSEGEHLRARLLREAQAIARIAHPNVVAVYDVTAHHDEVVIAMELVEGRTLRQWLHAERPGWPRVLSVLAQAGRGLASAHAAGFLHRDFKPDNVLMGRDGRPRVADFGLVSMRGADGPSTLDESVASGKTASEAMHARSKQQTSLTAHGMRLGTPAYMAPEQHEGAEIDARADLFAFCVTAFEALYGTRPFRGSSPQAIAEAMRAGPPRPPSGSSVPAWVGRVIGRGLEPRRDDRWPSMGALLGALDRTPSRRRVLAIGSGVVSLCAIGVLLGSASQPAPCDRAASAIDPVWTDRRMQMRDAFAATGSTLAADAFARTDAELRAWTDEWASAWSAACTAGAGAGATDRGAAILDRRMACLADRRRALAGLVDALAEADIDAVHAAVGAAASLPSVAACEQDDPESSPVPSDPALAAAVVEIHEELERARGLARVARQDAAIEHARAALSRAATVEHAPTRAEARLVLGAALDRRGHHEEARAVLEQAYFDAIDAGDAVVARDAAIELAVNVGYEAGRVEEGRAWARHAEARPELLEGLAEIRHIDALGRISTRAGDYAGARELFARAVARAEDEAPEELALLVGHLATAHAMLGELDVAETHYRRAMQIQRDTLGERHPAVGVSMANIANLKATRGDYASAAPLHEEALALQQAAFGPDHPSLADIHNNLAISLREIGRVDASIEHLERSIELRETGGVSTGDVLAMAYVNLGHAYMTLGRHDEALSRLRRGLDACPRGDVEHPAEASVRLAMGTVHWLAGDPGPALEELGHALEIWTKRLPPEHPQTHLAAATLCAVRLEIDGTRSVADAPPCDRALGDIPPGPAVTAWAALRRGDRAAAERFTSAPTPERVDLVEERARAGIARELAGRRPRK